MDLARTAEVRKSSTANTVLTETYRARNAWCYPEVDPRTVYRKTIEAHRILRRVVGMSKSADGG